ncbi:response regulator transcription factor [Amycolatopsis minnesotensis]|uniref:Response regulator transcription factor n=1 Tax=Amycolatopsis minnesotensis TaxID=337894 RepID=A0ABN2SFQ2_9PSEU
METVAVVKVGVLGGADVATAGGRGAPAGVLVVNGDRRTAGVLANLFFRNGYEVAQAHDGYRGLELALSRRFDVAVIDRGLPVFTGLELVGRLRSAGTPSPSIMLTSCATVRDRVEGLHAGADDCLGAPFDVAELLARVRALRRRNGAVPETLRLDTARVDLRRRAVALPDGGQVPLTKQECALLAALCREPQRVFSRASLHELVFPGTQSKSIVDTYVYHLRRKLGRTVVLTVHGVGYRLGAVRPAAARQPTPIPSAATR